MKVPLGVSRLLTRPRRQNHSYVCYHPFRYKPQSRDDPTDTFHRKGSLIQTEPKHRPTEKDLCKPPEKKHQLTIQNQCGHIKGDHTDRMPKTTRRTRTYHHISPKSRDQPPPKKVSYHPECVETKGMSASEWTGRPLRCACNRVQSRMSQRLSLCTPTSFVLMHRSRRGCSQ